MGARAMIPVRLGLPASSTATSAAFSAEPTEASSGATVFVPEVERQAVRPAPPSRAAGWPSLRSLFISTMMPMIPVDEILFRRRYDEDTVSSYVIYLGEETLDVLATPSIVAIWPKRSTFRFQSGRPARRLPARIPFISPSS